MEIVMFANSEVSAKSMFTWNFLVISEIWDFDCESCMVLSLIWS
ncbi:hypothetical protein SLEP1_g4889 [Rubroshorea leprosula]|uniref:Uncharacterized protein n=1 Tax=Rubroshorea leprosula TaxID=152421 RepID=A0AAV5HZX8_9ROSI|nr:hypothetical protein SLEP1_g4889 [Rubroshorea leprosula]